MTHQAGNWVELTPKMLKIDLTSREVGWLSHGMLTYLVSRNVE